MKNIILIFLGGGAGSVFRFLISNYTQKWWNISSFPMGTFGEHDGMFFNRSVVCVLFEI